MGLATRQWLLSAAVQVTGQASGLLAASVLQLVATCPATLWPGKLLEVSQLGAGSLALIECLALLLQQGKTIVWLSFVACAMVACRC